MALIALGEVEAGLTAFDGLLDGFSVPVPGQVEPLARCLVNASGVVCANGDPGRGLALADRAIGLLDEQRSPHPTAVELLGCALLNRGSSLDALGQHETALVATDRALAQYTRLVDELGYPGFRGRVGHCMANRADLLGSLGRSEAALAEARRAVAVLEAEVEGTDGEALAPVLDYARGLVEREDR
jgi:tetratricopeptide (TPR) repeat protein